MKWSLFLTALLAVLAVSASAKTGSTLHTEEMISNVRRNIERYEWVRRITGKTIDLADKYAAQGDGFLWELVTPQVFRAESMSTSNSAVRSAARR